MYRICDWSTDKNVRIVPRWKLVEVRTRENILLPKMEENRAFEYILNGNNFCKYENIAINVYFAK